MKIRFCCIFFLCFLIANPAFGAFTCENVTDGFEYNIGDSIHPVECVGYVRYETGIEWGCCHGEAKECYDQAKSCGYDVGSTPHVGSIVVFDQWNKNPYGHVGIVIDVDSKNHKLLLRHANWDNNPSISYVSENWVSTKQFPVKGYIYCEGDDFEPSIGLDKVQGSKEGKDDWERSFDLSMDDIYDMDFRVKLEQQDGAWPSDTEAFFYLSDDKELDSGDIFLGSEKRDLTKEKAKNRSIYLKDVDMADYISAPGTYYVLTRVEFDGGEEESSPGDKQERVKITVIDTTVPDLTIQSFQLNSGLTTLTGGSPFGMKIAVQNIGDDDAGSFHIRYWIKESGAAGDGNLLGEKSFDAGSLAAGATVWDSTNNSFAAAPTVEGDYTLRSCVDSSGTVTENNKVTESNEGNNCAEITVYVSPSSNPSLKPVYRFWSDMNQSHFYTISEDEKNTVINDYTDYEWRYQRIEYYAYTSQVGGSLPVYRFWSDMNMSHFYTISETEKDYVLATFSDYEWRYEHVAWYAYKTQQPGTVPVYRFWSDKNMSHFYTASETEKDDVIDHYTDYEWLYENIAWYVFMNP